MSVNGRWVSYGGDAKTELAAGLQHTYRSPRTRPER